MTDPLIFGKTMRSLRGGDQVQLHVLRNGKSIDLRVVATPLSLEKIAGTEEFYDSVRTDRGYHLRTIINKPNGSEGKVPAILFVGWLSCDSVEQPLDEPDSWVRLLRTLAGRSGLVMMRIEKAGLGDSNGPDCSEADLFGEIGGYRAALRRLKSYEFVDTNRIFIFGGSIGAALAPLVAEGANIRGLIVAGGFAKTWYEHMLEIERRRLELSGQSPSIINESMRGYSDFYDLYLNRKLAPIDIITSHPKLAQLWDDQPRHRCFQLMECEDPSLFQEWISQWRDLVEFEIVPVVSSKEAVKLMTQRF